MFSSNPFAELSTWISPLVMQAYITAMILLVLGGTIFDVLHKKSAKYFSENMRKYRYYVLREDWVEAGFDNSPDPRAIRIEYGDIGEEHIGEHIPHLHRDNKTRISLTEEMTFSAFVDWLKANIKS